MVEDRKKIESKAFLKCLVAHEESLVGKQLPKKDMPSRTQSTSDASVASENED